MQNTKLSNISTAGFTLIEVLAAIGISGAVLFTAFTVAGTAYRNFHDTSDTITVADNLSRASSSLIRALTYASKIEATTGSIPLNILSGRGYIRQVNWTSGAPGNLEVVAAFRRDSGAGILNAAGAKTVLSPTGIFYSRPSPQKSGVLFIDLASGATNTVAASYSNIFFDRLTEFTIDTPQTSPNGFLTGIRIILKARSFLNADRTKWRWCPAADTDVNCQTITYRDITRVVYISFVNQVINPGVSWSSATNKPPERVSGLLYFFPLR